VTGTDDFLVASFGRDKLKEASSFTADDPEAGLFVVSQSVHFNRDLVMWNGSWIRAPRTASTAVAPAPGS